MNLSVRGRYNKISSYYMELLFFLDFSLFDCCPLSSCFLYEKVSLRFLS